MYHIDDFAVDALTKYYSENFKDGDDSGWIESERARIQQLLDEKAENVDSNGTVED